MSYVSCMYNFVVMLVLSSRPSDPQQARCCSTSISCSQQQQNISSLNSTRLIRAAPCQARLELTTLNSTQTQLNYALLQLVDLDASALMTQQQLLQQQQPGVD